tara:strand:- start:505 stop:693 length:189 start_codon:yes stop_codon:yes gene_type:complete
LPDWREIVGRSRPIPIAEEKLAKNTDGTGLSLEQAIEVVTHMRAENGYALRMSALPPLSSHG